jgi:hypothetical protein
MTGRQAERRRGYARRLAPSPGRVGECSSVEMELISAAEGVLPTDLASGLAARSREYGAVEDNSAMRALCRCSNTCPEWLHACTSRRTRSSSRRKPSRMSKPSRVDGGGEERPEAEEAWANEEDDERWG